MLLWPEGAENHGPEIDRFLAGHAAEPRAVMVAAEGGTLVGFAELSIRPCAEGCATDRVAYLEGWFVREERRGEGIGRAMLAASEDWARSSGCAEFASDTALDNGASIDAHLACGFEDAGIVRCFRKEL